MQAFPSQRVQSLSIGLWQGSKSRSNMNPWIQYNCRQLCTASQRRRCRGCRKWL